MGYKQPSSGRPPSPNTIVFVAVILYFLLLFVVRDKEISVVASRVVESLVAGWLGYLVHDIEE